MQWNDIGLIAVAGARLHTDLCDDSTVVSKLGFLAREEIFPAVLQ